MRTALTAANLLRNDLDRDSAELLAKVAAERKLSLCGIGPEQTNVDFYDQGLGPIDAILIRSDLGVRASLAASCSRARWARPVDQPLTSRQLAVN